jgi:hypothetical protein
MDTTKVGHHYRVFLYIKLKPVYIKGTYMDRGFIMPKKISFSDDQIKILEKNPNILQGSEKQTTYQPSDKIKAVRENVEGKAPSQIFKENGFDFDVIGKDIPRKRLYNWRGI